jgi:hypothetical protein
MGRRTGKGEGEGRGEREQGVWTFKHLDIFKYCVEYRYIYIFTTHCRQTLSRPTAPPPIGFICREAPPGGTVWSLDYR